MLCVCLCVADVTVLWPPVLTAIALLPLYFLFNIGGSTVSRNIELHSDFSRLSPTVQHYCPCVVFVIGYCVLSYGAANDNITIKVSVLIFTRYSTAWSTFFFFFQIYSYRNPSDNFIRRNFVICSWHFVVYTDFSNFYLAICSTTDRTGSMLNSVFGLRAYLTENTASC